MMHAERDNASTHRPVCIGAFNRAEALAQQKANAPRVDSSRHHCSYLVLRGGR